MIIWNKKIENLNNFLFKLYAEEFYSYVVKHFYSDEIYKQFYIKQYYDDYGLFKKIKYKILISNIIEDERYINIVKNLIPEREYIIFKLFNKFYYYKIREREFNEEFILKSYLYNFGIIIDDYNKNLKIITKELNYETIKIIPFSNLSEFSIIYKENMILHNDNNNKIKRKDCYSIIMKVVSNCHDSSIINFYIPKHPKLVNKLISLLENRLNN